RALYATKHPAGLFAEHHRVHGRKEIRARWNCERWRQDGKCGCECGGAEVYRHHRRIVRRRKLRDVRQGLRTSTTLDVAERANFRNGRRASRECFTSSEDGSV